MSDEGRSRTTSDVDDVRVVSRPVCELTRHDFNARVTVGGHGTGWLYAIHDDFNDGYPSRSLIVVLNDLGDTDEWTFTDSDPAGYPQTMGTLATLERP